MLGCVICCTLSLSVFVYSGLVVPFLAPSSSFTHTRPHTQSHFHTYTTYSRHHFAIMCAHSYACYVCCCVHVAFACVLLRRPDVSKCLEERDDDDSTTMYVAAGSPHSKRNVIASAPRPHPDRTRDGPRRKRCILHSVYYMNWILVCGAAAQRGQRWRDYACALNLLPCISGAI